MHNLGMNGKQKTISYSKKTKQNHISCFILPENYSNPRFCPCSVPLSHLKTFCYLPILFVVGLLITDLHLKFS